MPIVELRDTIVAILLCSDASRGPLGLALTPCTEAADPTRPLYHSAVSLKPASKSYSRIVPIKDLISTIYPPSLPSAFQWRDIYLTAQPPFRADAAPQRAWSAKLLRMNNTTRAPFRFYEPSLHDVRAGGCRWALESVAMPSANAPGAPRTPLIALLFSARRDPPIAFRDAIWWFSVTLGRCHVRPAGAEERGGRDRSMSWTSSSSRSTLGPGPHWAAMRFHGRVRPDERTLAESSSSDHVCDEDHIADWPRYAKVFRLGGTSAEWKVPDVELYFRTCPLNSAGETLVLCLRDVAV